MIFHDYERMAPPMRSTRPLNLESQLARARQADSAREVHGKRFSRIGKSLCGLPQAVVDRIRALQLYQVPEIKSDFDA